VPINPALTHLEQKLLGRIPLVIGVTGHRDVRGQDRDQLTAKIRQILVELKKDYLAEDENTPVIVLSALAEGADRLVARAALKEGAILIAPLPMEEPEYRDDFRGERALAPNAETEFDDLLKDAFASYALPYHEGSSRDAVRADEDKRADQYQDVGLHIVSHCHVLIALWNGEERGTSDIKKGGTAAVVAFKRQGIPMALSASARSALDGSEIGPVIHVVTPREKGGARDAKVSVRPWGRNLTGRRTLTQRSFKAISGFINKLTGDIRHHEETEDARGWQVFAAIAKQTCRFNAEVAGLERGGRADPEQGLAWLFEDTHKCAVPAAREQAETSARYWCALYKLADAVAQVGQRRFIRDWRILLGAGFTAIVIFEIFAHLFQQWPLLILYAGVFAFAFFWFQYARRHEHQERFLDYRALAEALRVAIYWKLGGITASVADCYPIKQPSELAWVKIVLRTLDLSHFVDPAPQVRPTVETQEAVRELWVNGQKGYFERTSWRNHRTAEMRETQSLTALLLSPVIGLALVYLLWRWHAAERLEHVMIVIMGVLGGLAAVLAGYTEKLAHYAHARQYDRMSMLFSHALGLVDRALDTARARPAAIAEVEALLFELGREAMKENAEWVAIYRQRPIRPAG
jgi:hypothetical protein